MNVRGTAVRQTLPCFLSSSLSSSSRLAVTNSICLYCILYEIVFSPRYCEASSSLYRCLRLEGIILSFRLCQEHAPYTEARWTRDQEYLSVCWAFGRPQCTFLLVQGFLHVPPPCGNISLRLTHKKR